MARLTSEVLPVRKPNTETGEYEIVGYEWVLYGATGSPIAQQVRHSPNEHAAWRAFRRFCSAAQDIDDGPWQPA